MEGIFVNFCFDRKTLCHDPGEAQLSSLVFVRSESRQGMFNLWRQLFRGASTSIDIQNKRVVLLAGMLISLHYSFNTAEKIECQAPAYGKGGIHWSRRGWIADGVARPDEVPRGFGRSCRIWLSHN
jgi:hypothetical protein